MTYVGSSAHSEPSVLIPQKGSLKNVYYVNQPFWTVDTIFYTEIDEEKINPKFLYHVLANRHLEKLNQAGGVPSLTQSILNQLEIPTPDLAVQRRIVEILDNFEGLTEDLSIGLPAEIEARRKQYEYYRDKLLSFEEAV